MASSILNKPKKKSGRRQAKPDLFANAFPKYDSTAIVDAQRASGAPSVRSGVGARRQQSSPNYARYELLKAAWASEHPAASSEEYELAMRAIAKLCRV